MSGSTLRKLILLLVVIVFFTQMFFYLLSFLSSKSLLDDGEITLLGLIIQSVTSWAMTLPVIFIGLWAAHNLRPLRFLPNRMLVRILLGVASIAFICLLANMIATIVNYRSMPNFPNIPSLGIYTILENSSWYAYGILEILILLFATKQIKHKMAKKAVSTDT